MAKVLISFLGKGQTYLDESDGKYKRKEYEPVRYLWEGENPADKTKKKYFIEDMVKKLKPDYVIIIGTYSSAWWDLLYTYSSDKGDLSIEIAEIQTNTDYKNQNLNESKGLHQLEDIFSEIFEKWTGKTVNVSCNIFAYGINEDEIKYNFKKMLQTIPFIKKEKEEKQDVELHIDVTHSFRSMPIMSLAFANYESIFHPDSVRLCGIYYGMYELISERGKDLGAPVIDLKFVQKINELSLAVFQMLKYHDSELLIRNLPSVPGDLIKSLQRFSNAYNLLLVSELRSVSGKLLLEIKKAPLKFPYKDFLLEIRDNLKKKCDHKYEWEFQMEVCKDFLSSHRYSSCIILAVEVILTYLCESYGLKTNSRLSREAMKEMREKLNEEKEVRKKWDYLRDLRNNIAHGNTQMLTRGSQIIVERLEGTIIDLEKLLKTDKHLLTIISNNKSERLLKNKVKTIKYKLSGSSNPLKKYGYKKDATIDEVIRNEKTNIQE